MSLHPVFLVARSPSGCLFQIDIHLHVIPRIKHDHRVEKRVTQMNTHRGILIKFKRTTVILIYPLRQLLPRAKHIAHEKLDIPPIHQITITT